MLVFTPHVEAVEVCGQTAHVREITAGERSQLFATIESTKCHSLVAVCLYAVCDRDGHRLYQDVADVERLPARVVDALAHAACRVNGLDRKADDPN